MRKIIFPMVAILGFLGIAVESAKAATALSVEYYAPSVKHYFRTINASDIALVDSGKAGNWIRTGATFTAWPTAADAPSGALPVCRYYADGPVSHFYSAIPAECDLLKSLETAGRAALKPGEFYKGWAFQATEGYALLPVNGVCPTGSQPIYQSYNNRASVVPPDPNHRFVNRLDIYQDMADQGWLPNGPRMCVPGTNLASQSDAYRLLDQATFGANDLGVARVQQIGITNWVDEQLAMPQSNFPTIPFTATLAPTNCTNDGVANSAATICARDNYSLYQVQLKFLQNALSGQDQLHQRVAFALSQIFVTSGVSVNLAYGMARYQQLLVDGAFGNFRTLLGNVTLSPVMGDYLDMVDSLKPTATRAANENYAREIMQLFSIGLNLLNLDGTNRLDAAGAPIPSYNQTNVENLARVFTGWTYAKFGGGVATGTNPVYYEFPMVAVETNHDTTSKVLLNSVVIPAGQTTTKDMNDALDNLFNHANTGPFIAKQLIQKLVTGDPSPAYVARIATVFNNNGFNVRGDLRAVVRAILLDPEARGEINTSTSFGKLREPVLFATSLMRGLGGISDGVYFRGQLNGLGQNVYYSPTVFNYYAPDNLISTGNVAPEFEILNSTTAFARANFINNMAFTTTFAADATVVGATGTTINWAPWQALASDPAALVDKMNWLFAHGTLTTTAQSIIVTAVNAVAATNTLSRAQTAAYLVLTASQFQVER